MTVWQNKFIDVNKYARSGKKLETVRKIVVHFTANPGASAENHYRYFSNLEDRYASAHFFVDKKDSLCIIPLNEVAYHANDVQKYNKDGSRYRGVAELRPNANLLSIGVELCIEKDGTFHVDTIKNAVMVVAELCKRYKLDPIEDVVRHYDVTAKNCPAPWVASVASFNTFKSAVKVAMNPTTVTKAPATTPTKVENPIGNLVVKVDVLNIRRDADVNSPITGKAVKNAKFPVYGHKDGMYRIATEGGKWVSDNADYVAYTPVAKPVEEDEVFFRVVVGSFKTRKEAEAQVAKLDAKKVDAFLMTFVKDNVTYYRVIAGSYNERDNANDAVKDLAKLGFEAFLVAFEK
ncbi:N-acetylmuramoyl-L-alanine amidase [Priestia aryabhattai]|uniref:N-acetylmuramoyl-L-alanine amidase n=1 Tax=Priestia aryabhattai TaxID=412384 RepID=UPI0039A12EF5